LVGEIATASNEQSEGITQVNAAVSKMDQVTQANAATAEQTSQAVRDLSLHSQVLKEAVGNLELLVLGGSVAEASVEHSVPSATAEIEERELANGKSIAAKSPASPSKSKHGSNGHLPKKANSGAEADSRLTFKNF
jgi:hypothetical protein